MSRGSKYSDADRHAAVLEYASTGSLCSVSTATGISRRTLADWLNSEWWSQLTAELHQEDGELELASGEVGEAEKNKVGRPTAYKTAYAELARKLCLLGSTDADLAEVFEVSEQTINAWKGKHPDFLESITQGKVVADAKVAESLYERAVGCSHPETRVTQVQGEIVETTITKHHPPNVHAAGLWLKNRRPNDWRETRHIQLDTIHHTAVVMLPPDLVAKMNKAAGLDAIEGECEQIESDEPVGPEQP